MQSQLRWIVQITFKSKARSGPLLLTVPQPGTIQGMAQQEQCEELKNTIPRMPRTNSPENPLLCSHQRHLQSKLTTNCTERPTLGSILQQLLHPLLMVTHTSMSGSSRWSSPATLGRDCASLCQLEATF